MKQYTTPEQTAKLIELGFEKPKSTAASRMVCVELQPHSNEEYTIMRSEAMEEVKREMYYGDDASRAE